RPVDRSNASRSAAPRCGFSETTTSYCPRQRDSNRRTTGSRSTFPGTSSDTSRSDTRLLCHEQDVGEKKKAAGHDLYPETDALERFRPALRRTEVQSFFFR